MPFNPEVAIVFGSMLLALFASLLYAYWYQSMKHKKSGQGTSSGSESIRLSELEEVMRRAVAEATLPLVKRLETLESEVLSLRLPEGMSARRTRMGQDGDPQLPLPEERSEEDAGVPMRGRVR